MTKRVLMKDVAARAGVSKNTVSLALRNSTRISAATRERVRKAAAELSYHVNPAWKQFRDQYRHGHTEVIAYLVYEAASRHSPEARADQWLTEYGEQLGYRLGHFKLSAERGHQAELGRVLVNRGIRGVLLRPGHLAPEDLALPWEHFATVCVVGDPNRQFLHAVTHHYTRSLQTVLHLARDRGYRRPLLNVPHLNHERTGHRYALGYEYLARILFPDAPLAVRIQAQSSTQELVDDLANGGHDLLLHAGANFAYAEFCALTRARGIAPGVASLDLIADDDELAGIVQDRREIYTAALRLLHSELFANRHGPVSQPYSIQVAGRWHDGTSMPDRSQAAVPLSQNRVRGAGRARP